MGGFNVDCDRDLSKLIDFPLDLNDKGIKLALRYPQLWEAKDGHFLSYARIINQMALQVMAFKAITRKAKVQLSQDIIDVLWEFVRVNPVIQMCHSDFIRNDQRHLTMRRLFRTGTLFFMMRKMTELFKSEDHRQVAVAGNRCYEILSPQFACPLSPIIESEYESNIHFMIPVLTIGRHIYVSDDGMKVTRYIEREQAEGLGLYCIVPSFIEKGDEKQNYNCFVSVKLNQWTSYFTTSTIKARADATSIMLPPRKVRETGHPYHQDFDVTTYHLMEFENSSTELPAEADELASQMPLVCGVEVTVRPGPDCSSREESDLRFGSGWLGAKLYTTRKDNRDLAARCVDPLCPAYHFSGTSECHPYFVSREEAEREYDYLHQKSHKWDDSKSQFVAAIAFEQSKRKFATITQFIDAADKILGKPTPPTIRCSAFKSYETMNLFIRLTNDKKGEDEAFLKETLPFANKLIMAKLRISLGVYSWNDEIKKAKREQQNLMISLNSPSNKRFPLINNSPTPSPTPPKSYLGADHPQRLALQKIENKNLGLTSGQTSRDKSRKDQRGSPPLFSDKNSLIKISNEGSNVRITFKNVSTPITSEDEADNQLNDDNYNQTFFNPNWTTKTNKANTELSSEKTSDYKQSQTTTTVTPTIANYPMITTSATDDNDNNTSNKFNIQQMMNATDFAFSTDQEFKKLSEYSKRMLKKIYLRKHGENTSNTRKEKENSPTPPPSPKQQMNNPQTSNQPTVQQEEEGTSSSEEEEDNPKYNIGYKETVARLTQVTPKCTQRGSYKPLHEWQEESEHELEEQERGEAVKMLNLKRGGYTLLKSAEKKGTISNNSANKPLLSNKRKISETIDKTPKTSTSKSKVKANANTNIESEPSKMEKRKNKRRRMESPQRKK